MAKQKILTAFIEQVIQLENEKAYQDYLNFLKGGKSLYCIIDEKKDADGKVFITIRKQYNNNAFPNAVKKEGEN